jgi:DNA-binding response OmpR family regulator
MEMLARRMDRVPLSAPLGHRPGLATNVFQQTVLVVEDDPDVRELIRIALAGDDLLILTASNGADGLTTAFAEQPALVVLDVLMPALSGYDVCMQLRADRRTVDTRVLMLTACVRQLDKDLGLTVGADAYLCKPFVVGELVREVRRLLGSQR